MIHPVTFHHEDEDLVGWCVTNLLERGYRQMDQLQELGGASQFKVYRLPNGEMECDWVEAESCAGRPSNDEGDRDAAPDGWDEWDELYDRLDRLEMGNLRRLLSIDAMVM